MSPVTTINQWETPHTPCVTSLDPIPFWPGLGSRLLHEKTLFCSLIPRLSWNANILSPAQLQCSRSRAWEPGNEATFSDILGYKSSWQIEQKLAKVISTSTTKLPKKMIPCIAENYKGKKRLQILRLCGYSRHFSLQNLGAWQFLPPPASNPQKFFLQFVCHQLLKVFSLESFMLYMVNDTKNNMSFSWKAVW